MEVDIMALKGCLNEAGIATQKFETSMEWSAFRPNADGLLPVIVQDYQNLDVLMLAYMNEEAFNQTIASGKMTYYSRSRKTIWVKGETSGHYQYMKSLTLDCDSDTILAKVSQVGAACHTGLPNCFFQELVKKDYIEKNPLIVFDALYEVISARKQYPKEGSYTNYLFDKGIDKILKKLGEEATEIVIAAKNSVTEEIKYEISDFLYHMIVLMVEKGVTWEDITMELAQR
jgi:phosphoribosyl-ATP pyrophosphohydrolase/phosphoribosyl-AMP cyclohydrolase